MSTTTTTVLGLTKPAYNTEGELWGGELNGNADLIDAAIPGVRLLSGTISSIGDLDLALSSAYTAYQLILTNVTSGASKLFARFTVSTLQTTGYEYVRTDLNISGPTQTFDTAGGAGAIMLSDTMKSQGTDTDNAGMFVIDIFSKSTATKGRIEVYFRGTYQKDQGVSPAQRVSSEGGGALLGMSARATAIKIGGFSTLYTDGIRGSYQLIGIPGLA